MAVGVGISARDTEGLVELGATDLEFAVRMPLIADVAEPGTAVANASRRGRADRGRQVVAVMKRRSGSHAQSFPRQRS